MTEYQVVLVRADGKTVPRDQPTTDYDRALEVFRQQTRVRALRPSTIRLMERQTTRWRVLEEADRPVTPVLVPV
jgi:hypothetical protein